MSDDRRRFMGGTKGRPRAGKAIPLDLEDEDDLESGSSSEREGDHSRDVNDKRRRKRKTAEIPAKRRKKEKQAPKENNDAPETNSKEAAAVEEDGGSVKMNVRNYSPFQLFCDHILRKLQAKDPEEFFSHPVSAYDAPDYFTIITKPMDYSTMRTKIEDNVYKKIAEMKEDVNLIAQNAMTYNETNTVYYLAAQKLQSLARYYFSDSYIEYLKYHLPFGNQLSRELLGLAPKVPLKAEMLGPRKDRSALKDAIVDDDSVKVLLKASSQKNRLSDKKPEWKMGYIDKRDGGAVLNIIAGSGKTPISIGDCVGALEKGVPTLLDDYAPLRTQDNVISYTSYGPFSSFAPHFDSTWSSLNKKDSDLLLNCYGDRANVVDAISLSQMASSANENLLKLVDSILDRLTEGEHSRTKTELEKDGETKSEPFNIDSNYSLETVLSNVETLSNLGLDTSFIKDLKNQLGIKQPAPTMETRLKENGAMLSDLCQLQQNRLNQAPAMAFSDLARPDQVEQSLAGKVAGQLSETIVHAGVPPKNVISAPQVHQAMGANEDLDYDLLREFMVVG